MSSVEIGGVIVTVPEISIPGKLQMIVQKQVIVDALQLYFSLRFREGCCPKVEDLRPVGTDPRYTTEYEIGMQGSTT